MKKNLPLILTLGFGLLVIVIGIVFLFRLVGTASKTRERGVPEKILEVPDISERPYVTFSPRGDGRAIVVRMAKIPRGAQIDYEITYLTEGVTQGIVGQVGLEEGQDIYEREHILGTCSRNVCKYDKNVETGRWNAKIDLPDRIYEIGSEWHLKRLSSGKAELKDKFTVSLPQGTFPKATYTFVHETQGLPSRLPNGTTLKYGPYHFSASEKLNKNAVLQIAVEPMTTGVDSSPDILQWDGSSWKNLGGELKDGVLSVSIDSTGTFVVVYSSV